MRESKETRLLRKIASYEEFLKAIAKTKTAIDRISANPELKKSRYEKLAKLQKDAEEDLQNERQKWNEFIRLERTPPGDLDVPLPTIPKQNKDQFKQA
jgi:hypothetical protein